MTETTNKEKLIEFIQSEKFDDAYMLYKSGEIEPETFVKVLNAVQAERGTDTVFLSFVLFFAQREKTVTANNLVVNLLISDNVDLPGSYFLAYEYQKKILQEKPEDVDELKFALFFYDVPDEVVLLPEAKQIACKLREKGVSDNDVDKILKL